MIKKKIYAWIFFLFALVLIFYFSHQQGSISSGTSNGILSLLESITSLSFDNQIMSFTIRKLAHFIEYSLLGIATYHLFTVYNKKSYFWLIISILFCVLYACSDEIHQLFISGRKGQIIDICIDSLGSMFGIILLKIIINLKKGEN